MERRPKGRKKTFRDAIITDGNIIVRSGERTTKNEIITPEKNLETYDKIIRQLKKSVYRGLDRNFKMAEHLISKRDKYISLNPAEQAEIIVSAVKLLGTGDPITDLSLLTDNGKSDTAKGKISINKSLKNLKGKSVYTIETTATGLRQNKRKIN